MLLITNPTLSIVSELSLASLYQSVVAAQSFTYKWDSLICLWMKSSFHINVWQPVTPLENRLKIWRKLPIYGTTPVSILLAFYHVQNAWILHTWKASYWDFLTRYREIVWLAPNVFFFLWRQSEMAICCFMWIIYLIIQKTKHSQAKSGTWVDEGRCNYPQSSSI